MLVEPEPRNGVYHFSLLDFDFDLVNILDGFEGSIEGVVLLVALRLFGKDGIIPKVLYVFGIVHGVHFRVGPHRLSIVLRVRLLRFH